MQAALFKLSMAHPGDVSALAALIDRGEVDPGEIVAVIGKTEGNGGVNDFTRGYFTQSLMGLLAARLGDVPEAILKRVPCVLSGGTEGVLSPHYMVFCRSADRAAARVKAPHWPSGLPSARRSRQSMSDAVRTSLRLPMRSAVPWPMR